MRDRIHGDAVGGLAVLAGAVVTGLANTQPWVHLGALGFLPIVIVPSVDVGFGDVPLGTATAPRLEVVLIGAAVLLAGAASARIATRTRWAGVLTRAVCGVLGAGLAVVAAGLWMVITDPLMIADLPGTTPVIDAAARVIALARYGGVLDVSAGIGLWLLTAGCALVLAGTCIPVGTRHRAPGGPHRQDAPDPLPPARPSASGTTRPIPLSRVPLPAGWYPDRTDPALLRWFDGVRWTESTQPRG